MLLLRRLLVALVAAGALACSSTDAPSPKAVAPPPPPPKPPASSSEAFEILRTADAFEDTQVGYGGDLSRYVAAFRVVLAEPSARASFHALVDHATPAGRLYGVAGLYFADPPAFDEAVARLAAEGGTVTTRGGCDTATEPVAEVVRTKETKRIVIPAGTTLKAWFAANPGGNHCDIAGGCKSLMFVEDGRPAPRGPATTSSR